MNIETAYKVLAMANAGLLANDNQLCSLRALSNLTIKLSRRDWSSKSVGAKVIRRIAVAQIGSASVLDDQEFANRMVKLVITKYLPMVLRAAAGMYKDYRNREPILAAARRCEEEGTEQAARKAKEVTEAATIGSAAFASAAVDYAAHAVFIFSSVRYTYVGVVNDIAVGAIAAAQFFGGASRDKALSDFAEEIVQILILAKTPGCQWLSLAE